LVDDNIETILVAVEEGKSIFFNIRNFLQFQLSTSLAALFLVAAATTFGLPNPLNAMQILWINIIMDGPPAQSLGVEGVDPEVVKQPPRKREEPIISAKLLVKVFVAAAVVVAGTFYVYSTEMLDGNVTRRDTTMTFTTFVMFDLFNAMSCRSQTKSVFALGLFSNQAFLYAVSFSFVGQLSVIYFSPLQAIFHTEGLALSDLLFIILLSSSVLWVDEIRKHLMNQNGKQKQSTFIRI